MKKDYKKAPFTKLHMILYVCTVLGWTACGYALGIAGTAVTQAQGKLGLSTFWVGLLGAGTSIGLAGSLVVGNVADKIGRSKLTLADMVLFSICSVFQLFTSSVGVLMFLRICIGLCIVVDYTVETTIISEWFLPKDGLVYLSWFAIFWTLGYVVSFFARLVTGNPSMDYHIIFVTSVIPGMTAVIARIVIGAPGSPTWLAAIGRSDEADKLIVKKLGDGYYVMAEDNNTSDEKVSVMELFNPKHRRNTLVGGAFYACQVFPYFGVGIFLPILIASLSMGDANTSSILYDVFCTAGVFIGAYLCSRILRRRFLYSTSYILAIVLGIMTVGHGGSMVITVVLFCVYALSMSVAVVMENPYPPELFDTRARGTGVSIVITFSRIGVAAGTFLLPILVERIGVYSTLGVCLIILLIGGVVYQLFAPETSIKEAHTTEMNENLAAN